MNEKPVFVLVGHCGPDNAMLKNAVQRSVPDASITIVTDDDALGRHLDPDSILLINRMLDGEFQNSSGIELIRRLHEARSAPILILISDLPDAQEQARSAGAAAGFGKTQLSDAATARILRDAADATQMGR